MVAIRSALAVAGVPGSDVAAVGLTGQEHGAVLLDRAGAVLRPAILAGVGADGTPTVDAASAALVVASPAPTPGPDAATCAEAHAVDRDLYPALAPLFPRMHANAGPSRT